MRAEQIHKKNILKSFCVCVSLLLNFNLKNADTPPELVKTWHLGTEHFPTSQRAPTNRHWASAVTTTISPCCKASIWGSSSCRAHQLLARLKEVISGQQTNSWGSNTSTTSRIQNPLPNMGRKQFPQLSDPPFIAGQHMLLPPTSALPISQHCLAERPALHSVRRARPMQPCPATASRGRSWRQPALSTGSSCSARCSPPNQRYNWIANKTFPKNTHQRVRLEEPAPSQTALFMDNYQCTRPHANLQNVIYGVHHNLREGRNPQNFQRRENSAGLSQLSWQLKCTQTFQTQTSRPADSTGYPSGPVAERMAAQAHSLLPLPMKVLQTTEIHLRCQPQRPVLPPPAFGRSPSKRVDLCCSLEAATYFLRKAAYFSEKKTICQLTCFAQNWIRTHVSYISLISISNICILHICISTATISTYQTRTILISRRV